MELWRGSRVRLSGPKKPREPPGTPLSERRRSMKNSLRSLAVATSVIACLAVGTSPASALPVISGPVVPGQQLVKGGDSPNGLLPDDFLCKLFRSC